MKAKVRLEGTPRGTWPPASGGQAVRVYNEDGAELWTTAPQFSGANLTDVSNPIKALCQGRLTLTSGTPVVTADQTAQTTIYFTPYLGNELALYDGSSAWTVLSFTEISVAVPSTLFKVFDIYVYNNSGTATLETTDWNQTTAAATGATAAAPCVVTSVGHGLANGNLVGVAGFNNTVGTDATNGINGRIYTISGVTADTFALEGSNTGGLAASTDGDWYLIPNTRVTALTTQNGVYVKTGATTRRWLGIGMTTGTSGQIEDSLQHRLLVNYYNRVTRLLAVYISGSHTYTTNTWRLWNRNNSAKRHWISLGLEPSFVGIAGDVDPSGDGVRGQVGFAVDIVNDNNGYTIPFYSDVAQPIQAGSVALVDSPAAGYHYMALLERGATTVTFTQGILGAVIPG